MKSSKIVTIFATAAILAMLFFGYLFHNDISVYWGNTELSCIVLLCFAWIFFSFYLLGYRPASITVLFFFSFFVFIFGRYLSFIISEKEIFEISFFVHYELNAQEKVKLTFSVLIISLSAFAGSILVRDISKANTTHAIEEPDKNNNIKKTLEFLIAISCALFIYNSAQAFLTSLNHGYLALYSAQGKSFSGSLPAATLFYASLGLSYALNLQRAKRLAISTLCVGAALSLLAGQRGGFMTSLLFLLWAYGLNHQVKWRHLALSLSVFFILLTFLGQFSARELDENTEFSLKTIGDFLYIQGGTLMIFDASTKVDGYPMMAFIQSFIPGFSRLLSSFIEIKPYDVSYSDFLSFTLNPNLYISGQGVGWSLPGTFYTWSLGNIFVISAISVSFGYILKKLDQNSSSTPFVTGLCACIVSDIMFLPRGQFSTMIPLAVFYSLSYIFLVSLLRASQQKHNN